MTKVDVAIIGSGYGGLAAGLELAENGVKVAIFEKVKYPGGCASTFSKKALVIEDGLKGDCLFESGATLFSGFHNGGLFDRWIQKHGWDVQFQELQPIIDFRGLGWQVAISPVRSETVAAFLALPSIANDPKLVHNVKHFFTYQEQIADILWPIFDDAARLPPFSAEALRWHVGRSWHYPKLWPLLNQSLYNVLCRFGLQDCAPIIEYCNALCQITIQCGVQDAEAVFALSAMDYVFRGTGHIHGGIGELSWAMWNSIEKMGGMTSLSDQVKSLEWLGAEEGWKVQTRKGMVQSKIIIANTLPDSLKMMISSSLISVQPKKWLNHVEENLSKSWGACMFYLLIKDHPDLPSAAHHYQAFANPQQPLQEGNHIFCSLSARNEGKAPDGYRTATVSTHIPLDYLGQPKEAQAQKVQAVQEEMRETLSKQLPEVFPHIVEWLPGSPRTFQRFTNRINGKVGGIPKSKGWHNYRNLWVQPAYPNLFVVGDSVFPGQSTLACALGGIRVARHIQKKLL